MRSLPFLKTQVVALLLSYSFHDCHANLTIGGPFHFSTKASLGKRRTKQQEDENLKRFKDFAVTQGTAALIGAGAGVAATFISQRIHEIGQKMPQQHHLPQQHHRVNPRSYQDVEKNHQISKQRRGDFFSQFLAVLALAGFGAMLFFKEAFRDQVQNFLSTANSNVAVPLGDWVTTSLLPWVTNSLIPSIGMILRRLGTFLMAALEWLVGVGGSVGTFLMAALERLFDMGGFVAKMLTGVVLVFLLAALVVGIVIAQPTLHEIGQDLSDELQHSYQRHKRMRRYEMWG